MGSLQACEAMINKSTEKHFNLRWRHPIQEITTMQQLEEEEVEVHFVEIVEVEAEVEDLNKGTSMSKDPLEVANNVITARSSGMCK